MNLVTIAIDDLFAYDQFRDSFGVRIETPNLDRLMAQAVNFENAYAAVAICAPSRAATMSGKTPFETGVHDNFTPLFDVVDAADTWPAMIRDNGYFATASGKVFHSKGGTKGVQDAYSEPIVVTKSTLTGERVLTEGGKKWAYLGDDADLADHDVATFGIEFLDRAPSDRPFLLTLGFDHPHTAYFAPARFFDLYPIDRIEVPAAWSQGDLSDVPAFAQQFVSQPRGGEPFADLDEWKATVQGYLAAISHMDEQVGRFLDALAASDHAGDTAILLYSDHGYQLGAKDHPVKFTLWEESAKAPLMLYLPGAEAKTVTTPVSLMDLMPTVLELTGTPVPDNLVGQSLVSFATGDGAGYTAKPVLTSMYGSFAIRSGDFRYIRYQDGSEELYDLAADPGQVTNLAADPGHADVLDELRTDLLGAAREAGALIDPDAARLLGTPGADQGVASPGNERIALGAGDDAYFVFGNDTLIVERPGEGFDTVYYMGSAAFEMPDHVERVYATLSDNRIGEVSITGNAGDNDLYTGYIRGVFDGGAGDDRLFGGGWISHEFYGGEGDDVLTGAKQEDLLYGGAGRDILSGSNKIDRIFGGDGHDTVFGGRDNDLIDGGAEADLLYGEDGDDAIDGGAGDDILSGGEDNDRLTGGAGDDSLYGGAGIDSLSGGAGDDLLQSTGGDDHLFDGAGADTFAIGAAPGHRVVALHPALAGGGDRLVVAGLAAGGATLTRIGDALLIGGDATWSVWIDGAAARPDVAVTFADGETTLGALLAGAAPSSALPPGYGDQDVTGTAYADWFLGHVGDDTFAGKRGDDLVDGGDGDDHLNGGNDDDDLFGGAGADALIGGNGADLLDGGTGDDLLEGGADGDLYIYRAGDGDDVIDDKGFGPGDRLILEGIAPGAIGQRQDGADLVLSFVGGGSVTILNHFDARGAIEEIVYPVVDPTPPGPEGGGAPGEILTGTAQWDKLIGGDGDDRLQDGGGKDNLFGAAGADRFVLVADGLADSIKDYETGLDMIDLSAWGVTEYGALTLSAKAGRVAVRSGTEILSVADTDRTLTVADLTADRFIFADEAGDPGPAGGTPGGAQGTPAGASEIDGTAANDKLFGTDGIDTLIDGAGKDNLFGGGGADTFVLSADGAPDAVKDFDPSVDTIDVSAWGARAVGDLEIGDNGAGKAVVRFGDEVLSVASRDAPLTAEDIAPDVFVF